MKHKNDLELTEIEKMEAVVAELAERSLSTLECYISV